MAKTKAERIYDAIRRNVDRKYDRPGYDNKSQFNPRQSRLWRYADRLRLSEDVAALWRFDNPVAR